MIAGVGKTKIYGRFSLPLSPATRLDWALIGDLFEGIDVTLKVTPQKVKGRRELRNLECSINYDVKGASSRWGNGKTHTF
jgi:hypothetical protein